MLQRSFDIPSRVLDETDRRWAKVKALAEQLEQMAREEHDEQLGDIAMELKWWAQEAPEEEWLESMERC